MLIFEGILDAALVVFLPQLSVVISRQKICVFAY